jgi:NTP pyrophosphatase (non-canonical NTP hydrolase)
MLIEFDDKKLERIIRHYGEKHQAMKCCEEMVELADELKKDVINDNFVIDEIADVLVTVLQMALIFGIDKVMKRVKYKIARTTTRIWIAQIKRLCVDLKNG